MIEYFCGLKFTLLSSFQELDLLPALQKALQDIGFETPTEIQSKAIPALDEYPQDFIGLAKTGTGKTAAFGLPLLNQIDVQKKHVQGVIIAPTRELVQQITKELKNFGKYIRGFKITAVYGGASIVAQMKEIRKDKPQIIVASPGRLIDLSGRGVVKLDQIHTVILDEADEMLNMGFQEDIDKILEYTP
ncbi:MAG: DEAD/DEAH box helicase, partial [Bacteroidia bacterium]|nr:DEAD/DEAH box helicase [Bacteroidia bacterium]